MVNKNLNGIVMKRIKQCFKSVFITLIIIIINIHVSDLLFSLFALQLLLVEFDNCQLSLQLKYKLQKKYSMKE